MGSILRVTTRGTVYPQHGSVRRFVAILEARGAARNVGLMAIVLSACSVQQLQAYLGVIIGCDRHQYYIRVLPVASFNSRPMMMSLTVPAREQAEIPVGRDLCRTTKKLIHRPSDTVNRFTVRMGGLNAAFLFKSLTYPPAPPCST